MIFNGKFRCCNGTTAVGSSCRLIRQAAAPCNVAGGEICCAIVYLHDYLCLCRLRFKQRVQGRRAAQDSLWVSGVRGARIVRRHKDVRARDRHMELVRSTAFLLYYTVMGARRRRHNKKGTCPPLENVHEARFVSFTPFWFAQKVPKSGHVSRLKIYRNCDCGRGLCPGSHHCGSLQRSHSDRPPAVLKGFALQQRRKSGVDRAGRKGRVE